ncbi:hypothetical protein BC835DRAFT_316036 [Cytidiella melzeri]|nr:hypothetical protein BC835DRAFT_316036 [Cytidiella melzeri]
MAILVIGGVGFLPFLTWLRERSDHQSCCTQHLLCTVCHRRSMTRSTKLLDYTSSTGGVCTGAPFNVITEDQVQIPKQGYDAYHHTKAWGEAIVLDAGKKNGIAVGVLRPCGMTAERDKQLFWRLAEIVEKKQHTVQNRRQYQSRGLLLCWERR